MTPPLSDGTQPLGKKEKKFVELAERSARAPTAENRAKARKAYNDLPNDSPLKGTRFEG